MHPAGGFTCRRDSFVKGVSDLEAEAVHVLEVRFEVAELDTGIDRISNRIPALPMKVSISFELS